MKAVCIGSLTAEKARELGMEVHVSAEANTGAMCRLLCDLHQLQN
jgi:uroporphyrinogen-III synthase